MFKKKHRRRVTNAKPEPLISQKSNSKMVSFSTAATAIVAATIALSSSSPALFCNAFVPASSNIIPPSQSQLRAIDEKMMERLDGIRRSYNALTERLADPDVIGDSNLLRQVMSDRSKSEEVVLAFEEVRFLLLRSIMFIACAALAATQFHSPRLLHVLLPTRNEMTSSDSTANSRKNWRVPRNCSRTPATTRT